MLPFSWAPRPGDIVVLPATIGRDGSLPCSCHYYSIASRGKHPSTHWKEAGGISESTEHGGEKTNHFTDFLRIYHQQIRGKQVPLMEITHTTHKRSKGKQFDVPVLSTVNEKSQKQTVRCSKWLQFELYTCVTQPATAGRTWPVLLYNAALG